MILDISDIPIHYKRDKPYVNHKKYGRIDLTIQKTGYGQRTFFICPVCGSRRQKLIVDGDKISGCRSCVNYNFYATRQNLYTKGDFYILWKMYTTAWKKGLDINFPFHVEDYLFNKPSGISNKEYEFLLKQLYMLECIRKQRIVYHARPDVKTINFLISYAAINSCVDTDDLQYLCTSKCMEFYKPTNAESQIRFLIERR